MSYTVNAMTTRNICGNFALEQVVSHHAPSSCSVHPHLCARSADPGIQTGLGRGVLNCD